LKVVAPDLLIYPDYDGNGMFKSLGNIRSNPQVGLLFIAMNDKPRRLRVQGTAEVALDDPWLENFPGGQMLVRIRPTHVFPNCPPYLTDAESAPVEPAWKGFPEFKDVVPARKPTA